MRFTLKKLFNSFLPKRKRALAVDFGYQSIKLAELVTGDNDYEISILHKIPHPQGLLASEPDFAMLAKTLKHIVKEYGLQNREITGTIWGNNVITRHIEMPQMPLKELEKAVRWEAEKYFPVSVNDMLVDFVLLENNIKENKQHLLVSAVAREIVYRLFAAFKEAGLTLTVLDLKPLALWRLLSAENMFVQPDQEHLTNNSTILVADIGALNTHVLFMENKSVKYTRLLPTGGLDVTRGIQQALGIETREASDLKYLKGLVSGDQNYYICLQALEELLKELTLSIEFYHNMVGDSKVGAVILTGGESNLIGLPAALSRELGLPVKSIHFNERVGGIDPAFSVALGLALRRLMDNV